MRLVPFLGHKFKREREWDEVHASARDDLVALGDDIRSLDVDIEMPNVSDEARDRYDQALQAYQRASEIFRPRRHPEDLAPVTETLEEGRYAMAYAKAVARGQASTGAPGAAVFLRPAPRPLDRGCAMGATGRALRETCAARIGRRVCSPRPPGQHRNSRGTDYWNAPGRCGPMMGGYFNGFGGGSLLSTLLVGSALGAGLGFGEVPRRRN